MYWTIKEEVINKGKVMSISIDEGKSRLYMVLKIVFGKLVEFRKK